MIKNIQKLKNIFLFTIVFILLNTISAYAGFGVSPTDLSHEYLKPGSTFEKEFTLSRSDNLEEMDIHIEPDFNNISSWFTYYPSQNFKFKRGETTTKFKITVKVPNDAKYQNYNGVFRVTATPSGADIKGVAIAQGVRLDSGLIVTEANQKLLSITAIKALDSILNEPIKIEITVRNDGNVEVSPTVKVKVMNLNMEMLEEHEISNLEAIKPNETKTIIAQFKTNVPTGEYFLEVTALLDGQELRKERVVFTIKNVPTQQPTKNEEKATFIGSLSNDIQKIWPYILIPIIIFIIIFILLEKLWKKNSLEDSKEKWWGVLLGSRRYSRVALSLFISLEILSLAILYPLANDKGKKEEIENGQTQGVQDIKVEYPQLIVSPPISVNKYPIYKEADINSEIIYEANEDEKLTVIEETNDWYKVSLQNNTNGWLPKSLAKSKLTEER
ncbi:MAG TPA: SH3 domain-containing protein [Candidatus Dojkabacteria bacterium]|nr:SH3 domain-containing protein [Candidatus Dojkabacteria bacterium]